MLCLVDMAEERAIIVVIVLGGEMIRGGDIGYAKMIQERDFMYISYTPATSQPPKVSLLSKIKRRLGV